LQQVLYRVRSYLYRLKTERDSLEKENRQLRSERLLHYIAPGLPDFIDQPGGSELSELPEPSKEYGGRELEALIASRENSPNQLTNLTLEVSFG